MKKTLKALTASALAVSMALAMAGCGSKEAAPAETKAAATEAAKAEGDEAAPAGDWKFERRVEIMVPASEGGGLDTTIRAFAPYLEKEIGNSIVINNRGGGSGITGYTWSHNSTNDGYAFQFTAPSAILADAQGLCDFELMDELIPVSGLVSAEGIIFGGKNAPFQTAEEMVEYCKAHPGEISIATDSPNGISGALITEFCDQAGIELKWITSESNEADISLISGEVDLYIGTWSDAGAYVESGDINALVVLSPERNENFPDVVCAGDLGYESQLSFYRVFTAMGDTPQEAIDAFAAAVKTASQNPEWEEWLAVNGMVNAKRPGDGSAREYAASCQKVLGGLANICIEYATKRYRSNCVNWGMLPFTYPEAEVNLAVDEYIYLPGIRNAVSEGQTNVEAKVIAADGSVRTMVLDLPDVTEEEKEILLAGSLINSYKM